MAKIYEIITKQNARRILVEENTSSENILMRKKDVPKLLDALKDIDRKKFEEWKKKNGY